MWRERTRSRGLWCDDSTSCFVSERDVMPTFWKTGGSPKVERFKKRMALKADEDAEKAKVRRRDKRCRFPLCGCGRMQLQLDVAHSGPLGHKKMGGDPDGHTSVSSNLLLVCRARHKELRF